MKNLTIYGQDADNAAALPAKWNVSSHGTGPAPRHPTDWLYRRASMPNGPDDLSRIIGRSSTGMVIPSTVPLPSLSRRYWTTDSKR